MSEAGPLSSPSPAALQAQFISGAVHKLAAAVSSQERSSADEPAPSGLSLTHALVHVLGHFGCVLEEMTVAVAARAAEPDSIIRSVCEQHHIHVREIELKPGEARTFATPVLAFRGGEAVVLMPRTWRRWRQVGASDRHVEFDPRAYTFYCTLGPGPVTSRQFWRRIFDADSKRDLTFAVIGGITASALGVLSVYLMRWLVDWALPQGDRGSLALLASGWCVVAFAASNLRLSRILLQTRAGTRVDVATEAALVERALSLPVSELKGKGAGDLSERIRDASQFGKLAYGSATDVVLAATSTAAYLAMLMTTSAPAALAIGALLLLRTLVVAGTLAGVYAGGTRQAIARGRMSARLFELLSSIPRIKVASAEARAFYQWALGFAKVRRAGYSSSLFAGALTASEGLFDVAGLLTLYAICGGAGTGAAVDVGSFIVASACLGGLHASYSEMARGLMRLLPMIPKAQRVQPLLAASTETSPGSVASSSLEGDISLRHVTFHYADDDVRILDNVSLDIKRGQFVAIVGPSGCGKSSLIKLILGFHAPSSGSVLLDGKDLANLDLRSVRRQIGAVLQGSELLPSSILFNIVGTTRQTIEHAWMSARRACIADDIEQMPMKMFTMLSDRAVTISGGQKQRLLIARALVREPKIVIFDEATSALDNKTQAGVMAALQQMECTKICIAHRLSTIVHADNIVVMNKGRIVQQGNYGLLMKEEGLFRTLVQSQLESEAAAALEGSAGTATSA